MQNIERILDANDEAFLIIVNTNDEYSVELHVSVHEKTESIGQWTGETITEALEKLESYIADRVDFAFGNAFWRDIEDEREENKKTQ